MTKNRQKRILALIMALVMMLSLSPLSFADNDDVLNIPEAYAEQTDELSLPAPDDETDGTDIAGDILETPKDIAEDGEPVPEEDVAVPVDGEEPAEETASEEDAACEEETADAAPVRTVFSFEEEYVLKVASSEGEEIQAAENTHDSEDGTFLTEYLLMPGDYTYSVMAVGFYEVKDASLVVTGEQEELSIEIAMEAYPYGIKGMPLDYAMSDEEMAQKAEIAEFVLPQLDSFIPGTDYEDGQLVFLAESEEYAKTVAESYGAELVCFESDVAVIELDGMTVYEAVSAAADSSIPIVAADPNYIVTLVEPEEEMPMMSVFSAGTYDTYSPNQTWRDWVKNTEDPDPYVDDPDEERYQYMHDVIDTFEAWGYTTGSPNIKVLVLDSGIDPSHSDVSAVETSYYEGSDFTSPDDGLGHGTHCAGIIGADMGNGIGGAGIAPGVSLYAYKCLKDDGKGGDANIMAGISWGIEKGVDIISMSLGGYAYNTAYRAKVQEAIDAGITIVAAMGNDGANVKCYPAGYNIPGLIAVQATDSNNNIAKYSNYGSWADVSAPGTGIWSTWKNNGYRSQNGTSMATPVVAGSCALYMSLYGHTSPAAMESIVKSTAVDGIINVYNMVRPSEPAPDASVEISVIDCGGRDITEEAESTHEVKTDSTIILAGTEADFIIYTLDGTDPSFNGENIVNGTLYTDSPIGLAYMTPDTEITVKAAGVNADGVMGDVTEFTFTLKDAGRYYSAADVYGVSLSKTALSCTYSTPGSYNLEVTASFRDRNKKTLDYETDGIVCRWESSNEEVFFPADNGDGSCTLQVNGPGRAYLTCTALNSNGVKTAKCTVNVYQCVTDIEITGFETVAVGKTCTYRASVNSDAKNKNVIWSLEDVPEGRSARIYSSGYLKTADAQPGDIFTVKAEAKDGSGTCCSMQVLVTEPVSKIMIEPGSETQGMSQKYDRYGSLTAASICTIDIEGSGREDSVLSLQPVYMRDGVRADDGALRTVWTSSNRKVATVDPETGVVTAAGPGKTTITGTLQDASNKKAVVTVSVKAPAEAIEISGPSCLTAGKLVNLKAAFTPIKPSVTKVNWTVDSVEYPGGIQKGKVSIDKLRGTVRATADVPAGTVISVRAEAADGYGALSEPYLLTVTSPVSSVAISAEAQSCGYDTLYRYGTLYSAKMLCPGTGRYSEMNVSADVLDKNGNAAGCPVIWKSSNPGVVSVTGTGSDAVVTATGKGSARITATTDDSSAKSVSFTVRVSKPVESISITSDAFTNREGLYKVTGGGAAFKATADPADADIPGVVWKIEPVDGVSTSGIRISSSGTVTVDSSVRSGIVFKVTATAKDAGGVSASVTAVTGRSVQSVVLTPGTNRGAVTGYNSIGSVSWAVLHTLDTVPDEDVTKTEMDLSYRLCQDRYGRVAYPDSEVDFDVIWSSSDENIVTVDGNGTLKAVNPGRATVYCKAFDGNGVTAAVDVEVDIPASSIELKPGIRATSTGGYEIGTAAEIHNGVALGGLYGKPTCRYFNWSAVLLSIDSNDEETEIDASAYMSIDSDGTLKVRSGIRSLINFADDNYIVVTVSTTDGTELSDAVEYHINPPITSITARTKTLNKNKTILTTVYADVVSSYDVSSYMFDVVTDNPDVAGGMINASKSTGSVIAVSVYTGGTAGTAHITVKAKDGSGAQCVITVNVSD